MAPDGCRFKMFISNHGFSPLQTIKKYLWTGRCPTDLQHLQYAVKHHIEIMNHPQFLRYKIKNILTTWWISVKI